MIRLLLGAEDLMRIRIAPAPSPFTETMLAAMLIRRRQPGPVFGPWRRSLKGQLGVYFRPLAAICPVDRPGLDLGTLVGPVDTMSEGLESFLALRGQHLQDEIRWLSRSHAQTAWPWRRLDYDFQLRRQLGNAIGSFHAAAIGPHWQQMCNFLRAERSCQVQRIATAGIDRFLAALCPPLVRWHPPVLEIQTVTQAGHWDLAGRGLLIMPSVFVGPWPTLTEDIRDTDLAPTLTYPAVRELSTASQLWARPGNSQALAALLGRTRSAALEAIAEGCGTGELALRVGISPAAASQHATVLRRSGLIATHRHGGTVLHTLTLLGATLLNEES